MTWLKRILRMRKAKEIPELTDFLVNNQTFRKIAVNSSQSKKSFFQKIDNYLEKELIRKDVPKERWITKGKK
ncbi:unnamed protein product [Moneuplotes crassus]|uniref:Uncharacterized protein n=1 Tax=Euplotes crassus TaxID=5936 RepID=A0AAD1Y554_EUPCR|nr:unnamed protein product [Moneuplotes crassus]